MPQTFRSPGAYRRREQFLHIHDIPHAAMNSYRFMARYGRQELVVIANSLREAWKHLAETLKRDVKSVKRVFKLVEIRRPLATGRRRIEKL